MTSQHKEQKPEVKNSSGDAAGPELPPSGPSLRAFPTQFARIFFGALTLLILYFSYLIVKPYLIEIFLALVLFFTTKPIYLALNRLFRGWRMLSSAITCLLLTILIILPLLTLTGIVAGQALELYSTVSKGLQSGYLWQQLSDKLAFLEEYVEHLNLPIHPDQIKPEELVRAALAKASGFIYTNTVGLVKGFTSFFFSLTIIIFVTFFLFLDGDVFIEEIKKLSPLDAAHNEEIFGDIEATIKATLKGTVIVAFIQGFLGGFGFWLFGVPQSAFWGTIMVPASVIPVVGTALIWVPASLYLFFLGHHSSAIGLTLWSAIVIGSVDNLVRPYFSKGARPIPTVLILFSIMGGISYFGIVGFILGPLILSFLLSLLSIYQITILKVPRQLTEPPPPAPEDSSPSEASKATENQTPESEL
ncbi:MAG: AI-2E family transporter [Deltaproteobacteria bacterium]|nr:AI-2E family transporter [Deltaproteobacteria bacterium]MBW1986053.1 AI-2E family transporter [Deltaproteobacteria bacterium]MBW2133942.1 AI-2E family transporter [Deltaproteobacteria bacterium]